MVPGANQYKSAELWFQIWTFLFSTTSKPSDKILVLWPFSWTAHSMNFWCWKISCFLTQIVLKRTNCIGFRKIWREHGNAFQNTPSLIIWENKAEQNVMLFRVKPIVIGVWMQARLIWKEVRAWLTVQRIQAGLMQYWINKKRVIIFLWRIIRYESRRVVFEGGNLNIFLESYSSRKIVVISKDHV